MSCDRYNQGFNKFDKAMRNGTRSSSRGLVVVVGSVGVDDAALPKGRRKAASPIRRQNGPITYACRPSSDNSPALRYARGLVDDIRLATLPLLPNLPSF